MDERGARWARRSSGRRDQVVLATKFGIGIANTGHDPGKRTINSHPSYVRACATRRSAARHDHIDLYYQHRVDRTVPIETPSARWPSWSRAGKVRFLGLSEPGPEPCAACVRHPSDQRAADRVVAVGAQTSRAASLPACT